MDDQWVQGRKKRRGLNAVSKHIQSETHTYKKWKSKRAGRSQVSCCDRGSGGQGIDKAGAVTKGAPPQRVDHRASQNAPFRGRGLGPGNAPCAGAAGKGGDGQYGKRVAGTKWKTDRSANKGGSPLVEEKRAPPRQKEKSATPSAHAGHPLMRPAAQRGRRSKQERRTPPPQAPPPPPARPAPINAPYARHRLYVMDSRWGFMGWCWA